MADGKQTMFSLLASLNNKTEDQQPIQIPQQVIDDVRRQYKLMNPPVDATTKQTLTQEPVILKDRPKEHSKLIRQLMQDQVYHYCDFSANWKQTYWMNVKEL